MSLPAWGAAQTNIAADLATECHAQSLLQPASTQACDELIELATSQAVAPNLLAAAHTNRGVIVGRPAAARADEEGLQVALEDFIAAAELTQDRAEPLLNQAVVLISLRRASEALVRLEAVILLPGEGAAAWRRAALLNRALALRSLGALDAAPASLEAARALAEFGPLRQTVAPSPQF